MSLLLATLANSSVNVFVAFLFLLFLRVATVVEVAVESLLVTKVFPRELEPLALGVGVASISTASLGVDEDGAAVTAVDVDEEGRAAVLRWMQHFNNSEPVLRSMLGRAYDGFDDDDYSKLTCWLNKTCPVPP